MKLKFKTLFLSSAVVLSSVIAVSSCGAKSDDPNKDKGKTPEAGTGDKDKTPGTGTGTGSGTGTETKPETPKNPETEKNATEKAMLKTVAEGIKLNYAKKIETFASQVNLEDAKEKFKPETFDADKYKLDIEKVSSDAKKGIVDVTVKVSLKDGSVASDNVVLKVSGFRISPIDFILTQKDAILAELKKPVSKITINVENSDVVIPSGTEAIDFSKPTTFIKVGTYNTEFFDWLQMSIEEATKDVTAAAEAAGVAKEELFSFSIFKDIWNKKAGSLDKFFKSPMAKALFEDTTGTFVPKGVDFKAEIKKIWEQEKTSFGLKGGSFFVPTGTEPINFNKPETYKEVLKTPPNPNPTEPSPVDTFDPLKNLGGAESEDLKAIITAFLAKSKDSIVLERDGNKSVTFVYYQAKAS